MLRHSDDPISVCVDTLITLENKRLLKSRLAVQTLIYFILDAVQCNFQKSNFS